MRALSVAALAGASEFFAPAPGAVLSPAAVAGVGPVYLPAAADTAFVAEAYPMPSQPTDGQHTAAAFLAGAAVVAVLCARAPAPSAVAMAALDGREAESCSRRRLLASLAAAAPLLALTGPAKAREGVLGGVPVKGADPFWVPRKNAIPKPPSVTKGKCNVEKPCNKGAVFPLSNESRAVSEKQLDAAIKRYVARQPPPPPEK